MSIRIKEDGRVRVDRYGSAVGESEPCPIEQLRHTGPSPDRSASRESAFIAQRQAFLFGFTGAAPLLISGGEVGSYVVVWVTNNPALHNFVKNNLFRRWSAQYITTHWWLKV